MPQHYTVPTKNAFAALDDDSDADDAILSKPEEVPAAEPAPAAKAAATTRPARDENKTRRPRQQTGGDRPPRRGPVRSDEVGNAESPNAGEEGRGVRASRGRSGPRTSTRPVREGQREFDRQSGTGRGREMKKAGGGAHNWGNEGADFGADEAANAAAAANNWPAPTNTAGEEVPQREGSSVDENPAATEEPKTLSLDAYRAAIEEKRAALPAAKEAEAAEEDKQKLLQDGYQIYTKEAPLSAHADKRAADEEDESSEDTRKPRTMHLAEVAGVNMHFRGRRGGRGGRENGPSNQGQRPQQQQQQKSGSNPVKEINLSDQQAFPTLQAH